VSARAPRFALAALALSGLAARASPAAAAASRKPVAAGAPVATNSAAAADPAHNPGPVSWQAARMRTESRAHHIFLDGEVQITRTDLLVLGDKAVADMAEETPLTERAATAQAGAVKSADAKAAKQKARAEKVEIPGLGETIERFTIDGAVHVEHGGRIADGDHAIYDAPAQTLTLEGPARQGPHLAQPSPLPVLRDDKEILTGETILMHLESDEIDVAQPKLTLLRSQAPGADASTPPVPARVEAKTLNVDQDRHRMRFREQVVLHRGDLVVTGPRMDARSGEDGEIDQLEMSGGVQLHQGTRRAVGRNAVYDAKARTVVLTGDPRLYDRGDELRGERIEMALDSDEVRVQQVRARMHPDAHSGEQTAAAKPVANSAAPSTSAVASPSANPVASPSANPAANPGGAP